MSDQPQKINGVTSCGATVRFVCLCAAVVLIVYFLAPKAPHLRRLWLPAVIDKDGSETVLTETQQMNFWTPSVNTKDYLTKSPNLVSDPDQWQVLSNDEALLQFGAVLHSNVNVLGYRREEVWGHGRSIFKPGWWWTVNVHTNFSAADMGRAYHQFWKGSGPVFIEVVQNRGSE